jgi:hypothetical protein
MYGTATQHAGEAEHGKYLLYIEQTGTSNFARRDGNKTGSLCYRLRSDFSGETRLTIVAMR